MYKFSLFGNVKLKKGMCHFIKNQGIYRLISAYTYPPRTDLILYLTINHLSSSLFYICVPPQSVLRRDVFARYLD